MIRGLLRRPSHRPTSLMAQRIKFIYLAALSIGAVLVTFWFNTTRMMLMHMNDQSGGSTITKNNEGRYVLSNVLVEKDTVYFISDDTTTFLPPVLCSTVDRPSEYVRQCKIKVISSHRAHQLQTYHNSYRPVEKALMLNSLNPGNPYHIVWEAIIPAISMLLEDGDLPRAPGNLEPYFQRWSLFFTDDKSLYGKSGALNLRWWKELLPDLQIRLKGPLYRVKKLIVGTRGRCAHTGHCSNSSFYPEDSASIFRSIVTHRHNLINTKGAYGNSKCRITLVQRKGSRTISNFGSWLEAIRNNDSLGPREVQAVDFSQYSIKEQIQIASNTDVLVMIHGGALVHVSWLPAGAIVIDINPYMYFHRGLIHWMRYNLQELHLGHHLIQINYTEGQYVKKLIGDFPLPENCTCHVDNCDGMFHQVTRIELDIPNFVREVAKAVDKWRNQTYDRPLSNEAVSLAVAREYDLRASEVERDSTQRRSKGLPPRPECGSFKRWRTRAKNIYDRLFHGKNL